METFSYISELNAFDAWLTYHELPPSSIALWFALMRISNSLGRRTEFNASLSLLSIKCGQMDERTIRNARERLKNEGLISFQSRKGLRSAVYTLHLLSVERVERKEKNVPSTFRIHKSKSKDYKSKSIYIGDQTKDVIKAFECKIHPVSNLTERENLLDLIETYGTMDVMEAIQKASGYRGTSIQYVASILANKKRGVRNGNGNKQRNTGLPQSPLPGGYDEAAERKRQLVFKELGIQDGRGTGEG